MAPNAPDACAINPGGYEWFPLQTDRTISRVEGAPAAREVITKFLTDLWGQTGLGAKDTFLVGFSQGAMMALHTGLSLDEEVAGIVAFSGALIPPAGLVEGLTPKAPVAILHGDLDMHGTSPMDLALFRACIMRTATRESVEIENSRGDSQ